MDLYKFVVSILSSPRCRIAVLSLLDIVELFCFRTTCAHIVETGSFMQLGSWQDSPAVYSYQQVLSVRCRHYCMVIGLAIISQVAELFNYTGS